MTGMTFNPADHPRAADGTFAEKHNSTPEVALATRQERIAQARELEAERRAIVRDRTLMADTARLAELDRQIDTLYARPERKAAPIAPAKLSHTNRTLDHYLDRVDHKFDMNPPYQRGSVWTLEQRQALIHSMLRHIPIGSVLINNRWEANGYQGEYGYAVVDGKQRLQTFRAFVNDEFAVPADWFEDRVIEDTNEDSTITYSQLSATGQRMVSNWPISTLEATEPTIEAEAELYLLINGGGTAQTPEDMARARDIQAADRHRA